MVAAGWRYFVLLPHMRAIHGVRLASCADADRVRVVSHLLLQKETTGRNCRAKTVLEVN